MNIEKDKNEIIILTSKDKKTIYSLLIVTVILLSFEDSILKLYDKHIITYLLDVKDNMLPFWLVLIGFLFFFIWKSEGWIKNKLFTPYRYLIGIGYVISLYIYYRWYKMLYIAYPNYCGFGLSDLLVLALAVVFLLLLYLNSEKVISREDKKEQVYRLYNDTAIECLEEDLLGFKDKVLLVQSEINNIDDHKKAAISIGIVGKWGQGKSSFLNLLEQEISKKKDKIIIKFNPRHSKSIANIQYDFFQTLYSKVEKYNAEFSGIFNDYLKAINLIDKTGLIDFFTIKNVFKSKEDEKTTLNREIKKIGKKIIVIIDDLDRLQADEVVEIFKLIDYTASFSNIVFITAYDKEYINGVLESKYHEKDSYFSDKFFNQEIFLSPVSKQIIFSFLCTELKRNLFNTVDRNAEIDTILQKHKITIFSVFSTLRDVKRFLNMFSLRYRSLSKYDVFENLFLLYILKSKWYDFYLFVYHKCSDINADLFGFHILEPHDKNSIRKEILDDYLALNKGNVAIEYSKVSLESILEGISFIDESFLRQFALFEFYFQEDVSGADFKYTYFYMEEQFFNRKFENIEEDINWYFDTKRTQELCSFVAHQDLEKIQNEEQLNNYLDLLLYTNARSENELSLYFRLLKFFDSKDAEINRIISRIKNVKLSSILLSKLETYPYYPRVFIRNLVSKLFPSINNNGEVLIDPVITNEKVLKLTKDYLDKYIKEHDKFSKEHLDILYTCISSIEQNEKRSITLDHEACQKIFYLIKESPEEYFRIALTYQIDEIYIEPFYEQIFESKEGFESFITDNQYDNLVGIELLRNYWILYKANDYKSIIIQGNVKFSLDRNLVDEIDQLEKIDSLIDEVKSITEKTIEAEKRIDEIEEYIYANNLYIAKRHKLSSLIVEKKRELGIID